MRICWFNDNRLGLVEGDYVRDASEALEKLPKPTYPFPRKGDPLIANLDRLKPAILSAAAGAEPFRVSEVKFLSPVAAPTKIIGTPTNYRDHVAEADRQREVFSGAIRARSRSKACSSRQPAYWSVRARGCGCAFPSAAPTTRWNSVS
jgi:2-keto-4-pentenoate hydratase/2-oxohepta-3-ene-1,7-dioic acid hydratase in catechol pathway